MWHNSPSLVDIRYISSLPAMGNNSSKEPEGVPSKAQQHIWVPDSEHLQAEQPGLDRSPSSTSGEAASFSNLSVPQHPSDNWRSRSPSAAATPTDLPPAYSNDYRACEQYATPLPGQSSRSECPPHHVFAVLIDWLRICQWIYFESKGCGERHP